MKGSHGLKRAGSLGLFALMALALPSLAAACATSDDVVAASQPGSGPKVDFCQNLTSYTCKGETAISCADDSHRIDCAALGKTCASGLGCVVCKPGGGTCDAGNATVCRPDGAGYESYQCDPEQGMTCNPDGCTGACSWGALGSSYLGCDYYATITMNNGVWKGFDFAVALSNVGQSPANVIVSQGGKVIDTRTVQPDSLEVVKLPWVPDLKGPDPNFMGQPQDPGKSRVVAAGAYRVKSDQPIAVYQFNPLEYQLDPAPADCIESTGKGCYSYSNDASLLLPAHMLRERYDVLTWPSLGCKPSFFAVTASADDTEVKIKMAGEIVPGGGIDSSGQGYAKLNAGDVLQVFGQMSGGPFCFDSPGSDISGTLIDASKPIQVIAGHGCANVPAPETQACDHMEEIMFPVETLGSEYVAAVPATPSGPNPDAQQTLRILATVENTIITFDPPVNDPVTLGPSDPPFEIRYLRNDVHIRATRPIIVGQFMQGTDANGDDGVSGDPAMSLATPLGQYRNDYTFLAPDNYTTSYVDVVAHVGETVAVDGAPVSNFSPIGGSGWGVAHVALGPGSVHKANGQKPFGITVYGYGEWTSYMYPGGLNLGTINPPVQ
jgi:IgGFc binding protein